MKSIAAFVLIVAFVVAEPPPSNSYLPPPPSSRGAGSGYPQSNQGNSLPQVVAARSLDQGFGRDNGASGHGPAAKSFARNSLQTGAHGAFGAQGPHQGPNARGAQPRFNGQQGYEQKGQGYDQNAAALARNALEEANAEPASYNFGYMVNDYQEGTDFGHHEERQEESAHGEYHVVLPDGRKQAAEVEEYIRKKAGVGLRVMKLDSSHNVSSSFMVRVPTESVKTYLRPEGLPQTVSYEADERGFKPQISYEDTEDLTRSGYDSNANNFRSNNGYQGNDQNGGHNQNGGHANARAGAGGYN